MKERRIRIEPEVSKVRRARMIEDVPTILWAQLALFEQREGPVFEQICMGQKYGKCNSWLWTKERRRAAQPQLRLAAGDHHRMRAVDARRH